MSRFKIKKYFRKPFIKLNRKDKHLKYSTKPELKSPLIGT